MYREGFEGCLTTKAWFDPTVIGASLLRVINVVSSACRALPLFPRLPT